jgi:hypothetical protein
MFDGMTTRCSYENWPVLGCNLEESFTRTADREKWQDWKRGQSQEVDRKLRSYFVELLQQGRLVATGAKRHNSASRVIDAAEWRELTDISFDGNHVGNKGNPRAYINVAVFPRLMAPRGFDTVIGVSLLGFFCDHVLGDPEVQALAKSAISEDPRCERVFNEGTRSLSSDTFWRLGNVDDRYFSIGNVHHDQSKRGPVGWIADPDPVSINQAADALGHRWCLFLKALISSKIVATGVPTSDRLMSTVPAAVWGNLDFYFDAMTGNIAIKSYDQQDFPSHTFHTEWRAVSVASSLVITPKHSTVAAETECAKWLEETMLKSPSKRTENKDLLFSKAKRKWPGLARAAFDRAWKSAGERSGAKAWSEGGAPKRRPSVE